jgi:gliding motility-associated-like protein
LKKLLFILSLGLHLACHAQVEAGRQVIGCLGQQQSMTGNWSMACTAGEAVVGTIQRNNATYTNGFHQPKSQGLLQFEIAVSPASCPTSTDGFAEIVSIVGCSPPYTVAWSNGSSGMTNDRFAPGSYFVTITAGSCVEVAYFDISSDPLQQCLLRFFTAFSPDGDNLNDLWTIENIERPEFSQNSVEVYNRWGQEIWKGKNYDNVNVVWDGKDKRGKTVPPGTYFFVADVDGVVHKGYIEITI